MSTFARLSSILVLVVLMQACSKESVNNSGDDKEAAVNYSQNAERAFRSLSKIFIGSAFSR